jgi:NADH:ubiquinone oxidoreductase subunit 2 (subunit N)
MRIPTLRQIESALKRYALHALAGVLASSGFFFRDRLVGLLVQAPSDDLATAVVWLAIAVVVMAAVGAFYFLKSRKLEKAVLKFDPNFYDHQEFDDAFDEAAKKPRL